jgi:dihydroorotate dehydrogenase electron transfer subunit
LSATIGRSHRGTIFHEEARVLSHRAFPGEQQILRVAAPRCAAHARPGSFAHLRCDPALPMRRPLSILQTDATEGWVEFLYKKHGRGLSLLAQRRPDDTLSLLGPLGRPFVHDPARPRALLLGGGVGIPPMLFLAETLPEDALPLVLMGSEVPFPFTLEEHPRAVAGMPQEASFALQRLAARGIDSRLASGAGLPGCFRGFVTELAAHWLQHLAAGERGKVAVYACGPTPMLRAAAAVAARFGLPCQVSLEEYMACAVGGCAGCTVLVKTPAGPAMQRVCVDGPVFDAYTVF